MFTGNVRCMRVFVAVCILLIHACELVFSMVFDCSSGGGIGGGERERASHHAAEGLVGNRSERVWPEYDRD
jgi:hypothetical protein